MAVMDMKDDSLRKAFDQQGSIVATEAEAVAESDVHFRFARDVWHVVEIALRIRLIEIDGGGHDIFLHGHQAGGDFHSTRGTEKVTCHGLGGTNKQTVFRVGTEAAFDRLRFTNIAQTGGGTVSIDVADFFGVDLAVPECHVHATRGTLALGPARRLP